MSIEEFQRTGVETNPQVEAQRILQDPEAVAALLREFSSWGKQILAIPGKIASNPELLIGIGRALMDVKMLASQFGTDAAEFRQILKKPQTLATITLIFSLLGACNRVSGFVDPAGAKNSESPTPNLSTQPPEHTQILTQVPTKSAEAKPSNTSTPRANATNTPTTQEAFGTQHAQQTADFTPGPTYDQTIVAPDLTDTLTPTPTETLAPNLDLAAVIAAIEEELTIWKVDGGGATFPETPLSFSFEGLDETPTIEIPQKIGGGKIFWEVTMKVGDQEVGVIMAKIHADGSIALISSTGNGIGPILTREHIRKVFGQVDGKTCDSSLSFATHPAEYTDDWEPTVKPQENWQDMFFVGTDGKVHALPTSFMCNNIQP